MDWELWWKVCQTFHAETLKVFLYLVLNAVNNEQFMTSVLPRIVENTQRSHSGACIQLIILYCTLCCSHNRNPLNSLLSCSLSVSCWKADRHFKSFFFFKVLQQLTFRFLSQQMSVVENYQHRQLSACHLLSQYAGTWFCLDNGRQAAACEHTHTQTCRLSPQKHYVPFFLSSCFRATKLIDECARPINQAGRTGNQ